MFVRLIPDELMGADGLVVAPMDVVGHLDAMDSPPQQLSPTRKHPLPASRFYLENALDFLDTGIAQQAMVSGDAMLMVLDAFMSKPAQRADVLNAFADHDLIASNYVLYVLRRAAPGAAWSAIYLSAYTSNNPALMRGIPQPYPIIYSSVAAASKSPSPTTPGCSHDIYSIRPELTRRPPGTHKQTN